MGFDGYLVLLSLSVVAITGISTMLALFFLGARNAIRTDDPVNPQLVTAGPRPPVSIMKPVAGGDDDLEGCLESYARINYPQFEIVISVADESDAAYPVVMRFKERHPDLDITVVLTHNGRWLSPKVSNLECIDRQCKYELLWQTDANTRVHPDTLMGMVDELMQPGVGVVVSPLVGDGEQSAGSALDSIQMCSYVGLYSFVIHGLCKRMVGAGKSSLLRRETLERMGGWPMVGNSACDDYKLFERIRSSGLRVVIGPHLVANVSARGPVQRYVKRHMRWMAIRWRVTFATSLIEPLSSPMIPTFALLLWAPSVRTLALFAFGTALQLVADALVMYRLRGRLLAWRFMPLVWARPFINAYLWGRGIFPSRVDWKGHHMWIGGEGEIFLESPVRARLRSMREAMRSTSA